MLFVWFSIIIRTEIVRAILVQHLKCVWLLKSKKNQYLHTDSVHRPFLGVRVRIRKGCFYCHLTGKTIFVCYFIRFLYVYQSLFYLSNEIKWLAAGFALPRVHHFLSCEGQVMVVCKINSRSLKCDILFVLYFYIYLVLLQISCGADVQIMSFLWC